MVLSTTGSEVKDQGQESEESLLVDGYTDNGGRDTIGEAENHMQSLVVDCDVDVRQNTMRQSLLQGDSAGNGRGVSGQGEHEANDDCGRAEDFKQSLMVNGNPEVGQNLVQQSRVQGDSTENRGDMSDQGEHAAYNDNGWGEAEDFVRSLEVDGDVEGGQNFMMQSLVQGDSDGSRENGGQEIGGG